jgi:hypothetical protein
VHVVHAEGLQFRACPLGALVVASVEDGDVQRYAALDGFDDVGARGLVRAFPAGDPVVLGRLAAVVRRRQPDVGVLEQSPVLVADPEKVAVDPDPKADVHRALGHRDEAGMESRFTADELDLLGAERDGLVDGPQPVVLAHAAVAPRRPGRGVAERRAGELAAAGDLQRQEPQRGGACGARVMTRS